MKEALKDVPLEALAKETEEMRKEHSDLHFKQLLAEVKCT